MDVRTKEFGTDIPQKNQIIKTYSVGNLIS